MEDDAQEKGFKVRDRRTFDSEGKRREGVEEAVKEENPETSDNDEKAPSHDEGRPVNFASFVLSLSTSAMVHLGLTENPISKKQEEDLVVAQQEIHIIEMLKEKTVGNLNEEEEHLLDDVLFHLRMKYVEKTKG